LRLAASLMQQKNGWIRSALTADADPLVDTTNSCEEFLVNAHYGVDHGCSGDFVVTIGPEDEAARTTATSRTKMLRTVSLAIVQLLRNMPQCPMVSGQWER